LTEAGNIFIIAADYIEACSFTYSKISGRYLFIAVSRIEQTSSPASEGLSFATFLTGATFSFFVSSAFSESSSSSSFSSSSSSSSKSSSSSLSADFSSSELPAPDAL
jgi:hypothetical protein